MLSEGVSREQSIKLRVALMRRLEARGARLTYLGDLDSKGI